MMKINVPRILLVVVYALCQIEADHQCRQYAVFNESGKLWYSIFEANRFAMGRNFLTLKVNYTGELVEEVRIALKAQIGNQERYLILDLSPNASFVQLRYKKIKTTIMPLVGHFKYEQPLMDIAFIPVADKVLKTFVNGNPADGLEIKFPDGVIWPFNALTVDRGSHALHIKEFCVVKMECEGYYGIGTMNVWNYPNNEAASRKPLHWSEIQELRTGIAVDYGYGIAKEDSEFTLLSSKFFRKRLDFIKISNFESNLTFTVYKSNYPTLKYTIPKSVNNRLIPPYHGFSIFPAIFHQRKGFVVSAGNGQYGKFIVDSESYDTLEWKSKQKFKQLCIYRNYTELS